MRTDARVREPNVAKPFFRSGTITVTNTFTEVAIATGLLPSGGYGYRILDIEFGHTVANAPFVLGTTTPTWNIKGQLTAQSKTAILAYDDPALLAGGCLGQMGLLTTSGVQQLDFELPWELNIPSEVIVVTPNIYLGLVTSSAQVSAYFSARVYYEPVKLSEVEILRIISG
jgi:hypothetical protein